MEISPDFIWDIREMCKVEYELQYPTISAFPVINVEISKNTDPLGLCCVRLSVDEEAYNYAEGNGTCAHCFKWFKNTYCLMVVGGSEVIVNRILHNFLRCSSLLRSDCGLQLELGSSHCRSHVSFLSASPQDTSVRILAMTH